MRVEQRVRQVRLVPLGIRHRTSEPPVIGLASELEDPTRHRDGNPVRSELAHERVHHFPGRFACDRYAAARRSTSFSCSTSRNRFRSSRFSVSSSERRPRIGGRRRGRPGRASCSDTTPRSRSRTRGGLNRPSEHLDRGGVDGDDARASEAVQSYGGRPVASCSDGRVARGSCPFPGGDRVGGEDRGCGRGGAVCTPVGYRWFRHAGGANPCLPATVSGRYCRSLSVKTSRRCLAEGLGVREIVCRVGRGSRHDLL